MFIRAMKKLARDHDLHHGDRGLELQERVTDEDGKPEEAHRNRSGDEHVGQQPLHVGRVVVDRGDLTGLREALHHPREEGSADGLRQVQDVHRHAWERARSR
jgi:hypothetical protein